MRTLNHLTAVFFLLVVFLGFNVAKAQTTPARTTQEPAAQFIEAEAKLLSAQAAMVTALATANKTNAETLRTLEEARALALANELKKAETFYGKKTLYENHRKLNEVRPPRATKEALLRYSQMSAPQRLTKEQFDLIKGEIRWPSVLQKDEFEEHRSQIETLFVKRLDFSQDIQGQVQDITDRMSARLSSLAREVPSSEYIKARKFIRSLAYESQFDFLPGNQVGKIAVAQ